ncbi:DRMBL-domain-containing protein [Annulohypoxylon maeteangense]|uniref:DRMBL-domain-containing protein n=1 Tax=Annulohypoxylon maeteangense TaxID=1927788 RepID=UPI002007832B|nr:DRMBL-domain-containing protein [Annulohypoxylon maeteangense]KAI0889881.1 DRMBL-domain-containing protein [Annulohypoxylon maeteangense]
MPPPTTVKSITPRRKQTKLNFGSSANSKGANAKTPSTKKPNGNILNFFQKVEVEEQLFCAGPINQTALPPNNTVPSPPPKDDEDLFGDAEIPDDATNGTRSPKRRKLSHNGNDVLPHNLESVHSDGPGQTGSSPPGQTRTKPVRKKGPFLIDSDSEDDEVEPSPLRDTMDIEVHATLAQVESTTEKPETVPIPKLPVDESCPEIPEIPPLKQEESTYEEFKDLEDMEGLFDDVDEFDDGEEYRERRYMEEQARLEAEEAGNYTSDGMIDEFNAAEGIVERCPLCNASLAGISSDQATVHVNACLDGNPLPLPKTEEPPPLDAVDAPEISKRFAKAAIPRPGQANPIKLGNTANQPTSAFSKLMSGHAEDAAWATAAAAENASRGKPAYKRTCPFYKIMPGFFICVDAFRYGAVKGCNAYFLSHFHSDHYIGLTANWSHGPIYCSKVTGSLVKNQLRTAAKWVKELEFEETVEIPGTEGVTVTMIPANHCPGSSLFLFEKTIGKGPRKQRILHCGDFRACKAHVSHPSLKPDILDTVSGKIKQQKIDVCYLDTTYLNPRYSFPPQDDVISACAEFCKSISGDPRNTDEVLNGLSQEKGGVSKFFRKIEENDSSSTATKAEGKTKRNRLLVICGTYSIGKERICKAIAQALGTKVFASPAKIKICKQLGDPELAALMTANPLEAQVHMQMLAEIRAETLQEYLNGYKAHFDRIVGFRPSGWNYRGGATTAKNVPANTSPASVPTTGILHGPAWRTRFSCKDLVAQRGSTSQAMCFGVPYSEHSSFRELALFLMTLRIEKVVPTVNVGSEPGRRRMKGWVDRWLAERRKGGVVRVLEGEDGEGKGEELWEGRDGKGGGVWW